MTTFFQGDENCHQAFSCRKYYLVCEIASSWLELFHSRIGMNVNPGMVARQM